jgi:conjugative transfer signal peptidase TraF
MGRVAEAGLATLTVLVIAARGCGLTYNTTASLPAGVYRVTVLSGEPRRGEVVGVCLDGETARLARARGYVHAPGLAPLLHGSSCGAPVAVIGKPVAGVPGDTVEVSDDGVRINGVLLARSRTPPADRAGRTLPRAPRGRSLLGPGEFWVQSQRSAWSLDSRVFGPVPRSRILDRRVPLWTER